MDNLYPGSLIIISISTILSMFFLMLGLIYNKRNDNNVGVFFMFFMSGLFQSYTILSVLAEIKGMLNV